MPNIQQRQTRLRQLCESLKKADADLIDVIQFGSSVYAPELARGIDLLVTTRAKENEEFYWDTFADLDLGADVIVRAPGQPMGKDIAASKRLMGNLLCGDGQTFDRLFGAARYAVMAYLNTDNARWGQLRHLLPPPFDQEFRRIINTLHIQYSYDGNYPQNDPDGAFAQWRQEVEQFIQKLEQLQPQTP